MPKKGTTTAGHFGHHFDQVRVGFVVAKGRTVVEETFG